MPPILCLYTDKGPNHQCNYELIQIALICFFFYRDFDLFIAVRIMSNHSWTNPVERIISILNLDFQNVAFKCDKMSSKSEDLFYIVNTLAEIRKKA